MPLRNRVTPVGEIIATPERGLFLGNRGSIHDDDGNLRPRQWQVERWITCLLQFKGRRQQLFRPGYYTHLFFLDEATAFAAGHRPCAECRRSEFDAFLRLWERANPRIGNASGRLRAPEVDHVLHGQRLAADGRKRTHSARLGDLPDGVIVTLADGLPRLLWHGALRTWSPGGYTEDHRKPEPLAEVSLLTPPSITNVFAAGYAPFVHPSAAG